jgi:hypothetical protein
MRQLKPKSSFVLCVRNDDYRTSLVPRKLYQIMPDPGAEKRGLLRVVDESGEDYLFPAQLFVPIVVPAEAEKALVAIA